MQISLIDIYVVPLKGKWIGLRDYASHISEEVR